MEARIQTLAEDNDILRRENELNNCWVDNQQGLIEALERVGMEKQQLEAKVLQLETTLQENSRKWGGVINTKKAAAKDGEGPRMSFN